MELEQQEQEIHLSDYWKVVAKRKKLILFILFLSVGATVAKTLTTTPVYMASAAMSIDRESSVSPITGRNNDYIGYPDQELNFNTHIQLMTSKPVMESILKDMEGKQAEFSVEEAGEFETNPVISFLQTAIDSIRTIKHNIKRLITKKEVTYTEQELRDMEISSLQSQISISPIEETRLVAIQVMDIDPARATYIANLLSEKYIQFDLSSRLTAENRNMEWLSNEVYEMKKRLEDDEKAFFDYKQRSKMFSLEGKQKVIDQKIAEMNNDYLATRSRRQELDTILNELDKLSQKKSNIAYTRSILDNKSIDSIYNNLTTLELELSRDRKVYKEKHPKIVQLTEEIAKVKAKLRSELQKEVESLKVERNVLVDKEKVMEKTLAEFEDEAMGTSGKELRYTMLQRNMDTSQQLYDTLVAKVKEIGVISGRAKSNLRIVEPATEPLYPVLPNKKKNILLGLVMGLFGGVGLAFFLDYLDQGLRTEEDISDALDLPVLSVIPIADKAQRGDYY